MNSSWTAVLLFGTSVFLYRMKYPWSSKTVLGMTQRTLCGCAAAITGGLLAISIAANLGVL